MLNNNEDVSITTGSTSISPKSTMSAPPLHSNLELTDYKMPLHARNKSAKHSVSIDHAASLGSHMHSNPPPFNHLGGRKNPSHESLFREGKNNDDFKENEKQDLTAMSVLSLLDNNKFLETEMDTNNETEEVANNNPYINIPEETNQHNTEGVPHVRFCKCSDFSGANVINDYLPRRPSLFECPKPTIYFKDGHRSVDFVLVWDSSKLEAVCDEAQNRRRMFEKNLKREGLELEYERMDNKNRLEFLKIHAPIEVLRRYGEILKLRMPMKELLGRQLQQQRANFLIEGLNMQWKKVRESVFVDTEKFPERGHRFTAIYSRDREYLFDVDSPCFFTPATRSRIVQFILDRKRFSENPEDDFAFGIERLLNDKVYAAAYPLHDGDYRKPGSMRHLLYTEWASVKKWYRHQPLDYIKDYFGVKIGIYFAWLGFYTGMLIPASFVGLICFIYSCFTIFQYQPSIDACNSTLNITMCPQCDHFCSYWKLSSTCTQARVTYLFDNPTTVFFAVFMSIWATTFLELWKRYSAEITHRWDLTGFDIKEEHPRPTYLAKLSNVKRKQVNIITNTLEPRVPFWRVRVPAVIFSFSVVLLLVALAFAVLAGVVLYRMSVVTALRVYGSNQDNSNYVMFFTNVTAACINLCCIFVFNLIYSSLAEYLTEQELIRTETEFDDSLTLKIYLLQFVNYYASIFYIAFFKGKYIGSPNEYKKVFDHRQEECGQGGCLLELCIQLSIIMVGKQALNAVVEMTLPFLRKWLNTLKIRAGFKKDQLSTKTIKPQWVRDYKLQNWGPRSLFPEYLEMVLQYGFVTIFVSAFPLAPFFALLNNIFEMRLDARKLITFYRRPITQRVKDIGVWYGILDSVAKFSVLTNGLIIAFTSSFIPTLVYRLYVSDNYSLDGYLLHTLAVFNTSDFEFRRNADPNYETFLESHEKVPICRYTDYREPPGTSNEYQLNSLYWHILAARLGFVVIFENAVACIIILVEWLIPDVPGDLRDQIRREIYITNEIIIQQEAQRAKSMVCESPDGNGSSPPIVKRVTLGLGACPTTPADWDQIIESDFDFMQHSKSYPVDVISTSEEDAKTPTSV